MPRWLSVRLYFFGTRLYFWKFYGLAGRTFRLVAERGDTAWSPSALKWLGDSLVKAGHIARAQEAYRRCADMGVYEDSSRAAISLARLREEMQGDSDGAINAYYQALRLGESLALDPLISLLDARGDEGEADALRANKNIQSKLSAALYEADHHYAESRAADFHGHVIAALASRETVEHVAWALVDRGDGSRPPLGYLILTDKRLMLLDDFHYPNKYYGRDLPDYVLMSIDRADIGSVRKSGNADEIVVEAGSRFSARLWGGTKPWVEVSVGR